MLMDAVFGPMRFVNEITWKRTYSHGNVGRNYGSICDTLLVYTKTADYTWNQQYVPFPPEYVEATFKFSDSDGRRWQSVTLRNPGPRPNLHFLYTASNGIAYQPHPNGWACDEKRLRQYDREGRLHFPALPTGALRLKMYLDESPGIKAQNLWDDIRVIGSQSAERLGYPTQKPEALLDRIILASSNEGDLVLDPFCGCGTTVAVAQRLNRRWVGIDITCLAINLMRRRLESAFQGKADFEVIGEPAAYSEAEQLAKENPYQFQWWALDLVGARPAPEAQKKGSDKGIDGRLIFYDDESGEAKQIIISVKAGHANVTHLRDLRGTLEREGAQIGCLICLEEPTQPMRAEAAGAGFYQSPLGDKMYPRLQVLTVKELLEGKKLQAPEARLDVTFKKAPRARKPSGQKPLTELG
jgi:site-specific DNA-methyltransferase (adenine-specific)